MHLRGENIRSANDIGWIDDLTVGKLMRPDPPTIAPDAIWPSFCALFPLGPRATVVVTERDGRYVGLVNLAEAHVHAQTAAGRRQDLARLVRCLP